MAKVQAPKLQRKARSGPKPGNTLDFHYAKHASDFLNLFASGFPFPGLVSVAYRCLFCVVLVNETKGKSRCACHLSRLSFNCLVFKKQSGKTSRK